MNGLEAVEIRLSEIESKLFRLEAEFYSKSFLNLENIQKTYKSISDYCLGIFCGPFGSNLLDTNYTNSGVLVVRPFNIKMGFVEKDNLVYVSDDTITNNGLKIFKSGTLLFSRVGDIKVGVLNKDAATISPNVIAVTFDDVDIAYFLSVYFQTKYGFLQIKRQLKISAQPTISTEVISRLRIPNVTHEFVVRISKLLKDSEKIRNASEINYADAENLLLSHLGLADYTPTKEAIAVKSFSSSFGASGRLDSEYYLPKYEEIEKKLLAKHTVASICNLFDSNFMPKEAREYQYIELSNIGKSGEIIDVNLILGSELPSRARRVVKKGQVIVSSIEGSLDSCALITDEYDNALCSTGFYVVQSEEINSETLLLLFKSLPIQMLLKKRCSGTILTAINKDEFLSLPLANIQDDIQSQLAEKIQISCLLRKKSAELLELAKKAVEMAIEQGEGVAMGMLDAVHSLEKFIF